MNTLRLISWVIWTPGFLVSLLEIAGRPHWIMCDCRTGWMAYHHVRAPWMLFIGVTYVVSDVLSVAGGKTLPIIAGIGMYYLWRWWQHTKNQRKKLKDKVLGVVRETSAGLKVVPVQGGAS